MGDDYRVMRYRPKVEDRRDYGLLTIMGPTTRVHDGNRFWMLQCFCGTFVERTKSSLAGSELHGRVLNCGCLALARKKTAAPRPLTRMERIRAAVGKGES